MKGVCMAKRLLIAILSMGFVASASFASPAHADTNSLKGAGSSYANKFVTACAVADPNTSLDYSPGGSGAGRNAYGLGTVNFGMSDSATSAPASYKAPRSSSTYRFVPVVGGPIAIMYKLPNVASGALRLDSITIAKILSGKITKWNDPAIAALQTSAVKSKLPNLAIRVVYRGTKSGTSGNLTNYLRQTAPSVWTKASNETIASGNPAGRMPAGSISAANSQALVASVKSTNGAFGYADLSDAASSKVAFATIKNANGEWIAPTSAASSKFLAAFSGSSGYNSTTGAVTLNFTKKVAGGYNMSLITYAIVDKNGPDSQKAAAVESFVTYMIGTCGSAKAASLGYSPLTGTLKTKALEAAALIDQ